MAQVNFSNRNDTPRIIPMPNGHSGESNAEICRKIEQLRTDTEFQQKELKKYIDFWRAIQKCDVDSQVDELRRDMRRLEKHVKQKDKRFVELLPLVFPTIAAWAIIGVCLFIAFAVSI